LLPYCLGRDYDTFTMYRQQERIYGGILFTALNVEWRDIFGRQQKPESLSGDSGLGLQLSRGRPIGHSTGKIRKDADEVLVHLLLCSSCN